MKPITVLLADDNVMVRKSYKKLLKIEADLQVVGEAKNGQQAVALVKKLHPAVVLMDLAMPLMNGIEALRQIQKICPATKVLMLSAHDDEGYIAEAMKSGAMGYLIKHTAADCVCEAIREANTGRTFFSPTVAKHFQQTKLKKAGPKPVSRGSRPLALGFGDAQSPMEKISRRAIKAKPRKFFSPAPLGTGLVVAG